MTSLDAAAIRKSLPQRSAMCLDQIEVFSQIDSTNTYLKDCSSPPAGRFRVVIADHQTAGRGRRDKEWISAPGESLCLSVSFRFLESRPDLPALTPALGIGLAETLTAAGVAGLQLKWPNDLLVGDAKLGGILTETSFRGNDNVTVIVGIGINVDLSEARDRIAVSEWAEAATSVAESMQEPLSRGEIAERVIESVIATLQQFEQSGFKPFRDRFRAFDWLRDKALVVDTAEGLVTGTGAGLASDGALLVNTTAGEQKIYTGSIKRATEPAVATA